MNLLFVCTGNTCRSPMCEAYLKSLCEKAGNRTITVSSAGLFAGNGGEPASVNAAAAVKPYGADLSGHRNRQLTTKMVEQADRIVVMTRSHKLQLGAFAPDALGKTHLLMEFADRGSVDVADPFGGSADVYGGCFAEMKKALDNLFLSLMEQ